MPNPEKDIMIKRLMFRSLHRGSKETDVILGTFAEENLATLGDAELVVYEAFLNENDADIWDWVSGKSLPEKSEFLPLVRQLRARYELNT